MDFRSPPPRPRRVPPLPLSLCALVALAAPTLLLGQVRFEPVAVKHADYHLQGTSYFINNHGQVVGSYGEGTAIWKRGVETQFLHALGHHAPLRINDAGTVVGQRGYWDYSKEPTEYVSEPPFVWNEESGYQYIPTQELHSNNPTTWKLSADLNNNDIVVGSSSVVLDNGSVPVVKGWIWSREDGIMEIPTLAQAYGFEDTRPTAVNDHGVVVGNYAFDYSLSGSSYYGAFIYDAENGSRSLTSIDKSFFSHLHVEAHDINNSNVIVGTISSDAYYAFAYDLDKGSGMSISGFGGGELYPPNAIARAINNFGVVVGTADDWERASPEEQRNAPFIWSPDTGLIRLTDFTTLPFQSLLPEGESIDNGWYQIDAINDHGQISGSVSYVSPSTSAGFDVPFVLYPVLTYRFELKETVAGPEGNLLVFSHPKKLDEQSLSPSDLGKRVVHESSVDAKTWLPLEHGVNGVEILDQEEELQLRLPEQPRLFIRSRLAPRLTTVD